LRTVADAGPADLAPGVGANERLTSLTGALLFVLLAAIGVTILGIRRLLPEHFVVGFVLIPPLGLKMATTGYRFFRYYTGDAGYRAAGPPQLLMRLIGPIVVLSTVAVFATGLELWLFGLRYGSDWVEWHKLSSLIWLFATGVHVLGHLRGTVEAAAEEVLIPNGREAITRRSLVFASMLMGILVAIATLLYHSPFIFFGDGG
jgi:hypothetical protein